MDVKEIVSIREIRPIPNAPSFIAGILNLRNMIFPIIDLHKRFQIEKSSLGEDEELLSGFVIININAMQIGIIIDKVCRVVDIDSAAIQPPPKVLSGIGAEYIQGVFNNEGEYLIILNIARLFNPVELHQIGKVSS
jgi:purine-binding chemotaxis protein CheW